MKTLAEIFDAAADVIERNGHFKGGWFAPDRETPNADCRVCEGGAVNLVVTGHPDRRADEPDAPAILLDAFEVLAARRDAMLPDPADCDATELLDECILAIARWNDAPERTPAEVVADLRAAAAEMREAGR